MTKTVVLVFHPNLKDSVVNKKLAESAVNEGIEVRNIYELYQDFNIDVKKEQLALEDVDRIVFQFPMYWYSSPALLKEWQDKVLTYGWAYGSTGNALHGKEFAIAVSTGAQEDVYVRDSGVEFTVEDLLAPFKATSDLIGTTFVKPFVTYGALGIDADVLNKKADDYISYLKK